VAWSLKLVELQVLVEIAVRESCRSLTSDLELRTQPLTHPVADMAVDGTVRFADRAEAEIVGPAAKLRVDPPNLLVHVQQRRPTLRHRADLAAEPLDLL
jgi:hypothetical protein